MKELLIGLVSRFQADSTLATINGPYLDMAPEGTAFPYCVYSVTGSQPDMHFDAIYLQDFIVRFSIYHTSDTGLATFHEALHAAFDRAKFALTSPASCLTTIRMEEFIRYEGTGSNADGTGIPAYRALTGYAFKTQSSF